MNPQELKQLEDDLWRSADTLRANSDFIKRHRHELANGNGDLFVYGQEKTLETVKLAKMNLAVNGLRGDIQQANTYYEDPFGSFGEIEEDGKTEEEFVEELLTINQELSSLNREARKLEKIIHHNILKFTEGK